jgi:hypothetical protein
MYNFLFWILYQKNVKDGPGWGRYNGAIIVAINIFLEICLVFSLVRKYFFVFYEKHKTGNISKPTSFVIIVGMMAAAFWYYNPKRIEKILDKRKDQDPFSTLNILIALFIFFTPLILLFVVLYNTDPKIFENS